MSELVAEGWLKATKGWESNNGPLRFSSKASGRSEGGSVTPMVLRWATGQRNRKQVGTSLKDSSTPI